MMTEEAKSKIEFYTNLFLEIIRKSIKENIDGLQAGRLALEIVGCPSDLALQIEKATLKQLNSNS